MIPMLILAGLVALVLWVRWEVNHALDGAEMEDDF